MKRYSQQGMTLVELMITLAVAAVLMVVAVPSMTSFVQNERLTTQINTLLAHLQYARSEAVKTHQRVVVCSSNDAATCSGNWSDGWIVFTDGDEDGAVGGSDQLLRAHDALSGGNTLTSSGGSTVIFDGRGFAPNSNSTFTVSDSRGASYAKSITISNTGRIRSGS